jgi:hypothetical protein
MPLSIPNDHDVVSLPARHRQCHHPMVGAEPELIEQQPWRAVSERDYGWFGALMDQHYAGDDTNVRLLALGILTAYAGISVEDFEESADRFLRTAQHPTLGRSYLECAYAPMVAETPSRGEPAPAPGLGLLRSSCRVRG